jgi:hypothetical protein
MSNANQLIFKTCVNCQHGREVSTFPVCVDCLKESKNGDQFPGWQPKKARVCDVDA